MRPCVGPAPATNFESQGCARRAHPQAVERGSQGCRICQSRRRPPTLPGPGARPGQWRAWRLAACGIPPRERVGCVWGGRLAGPILHQGAVLPGCLLWRLGSQATLRQPERPSPALTGTWASWSSLRLVPQVGAVQLHCHAADFLVVPVPLARHTARHGLVTDASPEWSSCVARGARELSKRRCTRWECLRWQNSAEPPGGRATEFAGRPELPVSVYTHVNPKSMALCHC